MILIAVREGLDGAFLGAGIGYFRSMPQVGRVSKYLAGEHALAGVIQMIFNAIIPVPGLNFFISHIAAVKIINYQTDSAFPELAEVTKIAILTAFAIRLIAAIGAIAFAAKQAETNQRRTDSLD